MKYNFIIGLSTLLLKNIVDLDLNRFAKNIYQRPLSNK